MYGYEWTNEYGIFRLTIDAKIQKEIRPVFHEELDFFGMDQYWDYPKDTDAPLLWAEGVRRYVLNGTVIAEAQGGGFYTRPTIKRLTTERLQLKPIDTARLFEVNRRLMVGLEQKAIRFIQEQHAKYAPLGYSFICAYSGGKDSLVLLDLVSKALAPSDFYAVFSNTGMELSDTLQAIEESKKRWPQLRFEEAKSHLDPTESWDEFGPPGRRMRWCCAVHKSVPTILKLREITGYYNAKAVVFDGVRAEESARRAKYEEVSIGAKNISQINASPIHKWNTAELYCYLLHEDILLNHAYRLGLFRVGCMVCPLSSDWWDGIANDYYNDEMRPLLERVEQYAKRTKVESEVTKYIEGGGWKARMGGRGLPNGGNRVSEQVQNNTITLRISNPCQEWKDVAPILGTITEQDGNNGVHKIDGVSYEYRITQDENDICISYRPFSKMNRFVISHLRGVANKVAYCKGCKACVVQCPVGAFTIQPNGKILIRESLCIHCSNCLTFSEKSCLLAKSLCTTGGSTMDMKGMNPYQHFGLRQPWLEHFMNDGIDCFTQGILGTRQYDALKVWLKEAGLIVANKDKSLTLTPLFEKMQAVTEGGDSVYNPYNPLTWAIIWANLAYNSVITKWYCLNAEVGANYEKGDLVVMIGENYSKSNRENAITALTETLRQSPVGSALKQGIPIEITRSTYSYLREGWDYPHAIALLYSLYLYAEHTGRRTFSFTELVNAHSNPESKGMSPHDIYGIELKAFREQVLIANELLDGLVAITRAYSIANKDEGIAATHLELIVCNTGVNIRVVKRCMAFAQHCVTKRIPRKYQEVRQAENDAMPLGAKTKASVYGASMLSGLLYCAHCGHKLVGTYTQENRNGVMRHRAIYRDYYGAVKAKNCIGQQTYSAKKIEDAVLQIVRQYFQSMKQSVDEAWEERTRQKMRSSSTAKLKAAQARVDELEKRQELLKQEVFKSLNGQSAFSKDMLQTMIDEAAAATATAKEQLQACKSDTANEDLQMKQLKAKYQEIIDWADAFEHLRGDNQKMILARIIERITVDRNYNLTITFFITRDEFEAAMSENEGLRIEQALNAPTLSFVAS